jgi:hypothetical protein
VLTACGGTASSTGSTVVTTSTPSPPSAGASTASVCRTFEPYSRSFTKHFVRDAQAHSGIAFSKDITTLQASIGVALYDIRDPEIAHELKIARRAAAVVANPAASDHALRLNLLLLVASQAAIKQSCQKATQSIDA